MKHAICFACAVGTMALMTSACTTVKGVTTRACDVTHLPLNTGYDHSNSGFLDPQTLSPGDSDPKWVVISDPDPTTNEPREATVIQPFDSWLGPLPNSQWIGAYPAGMQDPVSITPTSRAQPYSYLYCFCLCDRSYLEVAAFQNVSLRADNEATVRLNDQVILPQTINDSFRKDPIQLSAVNDLFRPGINCLQVDVLNGSGPSGFNLSGNVVKTTCCEGRISRPPSTGGGGDPLTRPGRPSSN